MVKLRTVRLVGLNHRASKIIEHYNNELLLKEYDSLGRPLCFAPDGSKRQAIFCVSPDGFWNGWFILDEDVRFKDEEDQIRDIIESIQGNFDA